MAARGYMVVKTTTITYDGVHQTFKAGDVVDVPAGSNLGTLLGANAVPLTTQQQSGAAGEHQPIEQSINIGSHYNPGQN